MRPARAYGRVLLRREALFRRSEPPAIQAADPIGDALRKAVTEGRDVWARRSVALASFAAVIAPRNLNASSPRRVDGAALESTYRDAL